MIADYSVDVSTARFVRLAANSRRSAADDVGLRQVRSGQQRVAGPGDQRAAEAGRLRTDGVPDMGGDHHAFGRFHAELLADVPVDRWCGFECPAGIDAEPLLEEVGQPGVLQRGGSTGTRW